MRRLLVLALLVTIVGAKANPLEEIVVTAARSEQAVADSLSNVSVIGEDVLELTSHTHINESMQRVPGAWISRGNGQESLAALRSPVLTGAGACGAFLMMQDGIPLRASGFCNVNELFDANSEQARAIEVVKGPSSVVYGSNAMHGIVNVLTKDVVEVQQLSLEGGPHGYVRAKGSYGSESFRIDANGTSDGGYKDDSGFDQQKLTAKILGSIGGFDATSVLSFSNLNQETAGFIEGDEVYKSDALRKTNPNPEAFRDTQSVRVYSELKRQLGDADLLVITPYVRLADMRFIQHFLPGQAIEENDQQSVGIQTARYMNQWTFGADAEITRGSLYETQPDPTTGSPFLAATIPAGDHYDYDVTATVLAAFAERRIEISDTVEMSLGGRIEYVNYDYDNKMLTGRTQADGVPCGFGGCRFNRPEDRSDTFTNISPKLGLTWSPSEDRQVFVFVSRGFRAPQATELYRLQDEQSVSDIDSESLTSIEAGVRGGDTEFSYSVSVYAMEKDNFIFRDSNRRNVDNGETSHRGIEGAVSFALTDSLTANMNLSYAIHRYENNPDPSVPPIKGNDIDTAPREFGSANLMWSPAFNFVAQLEWVHLGSYYQDVENQEEYEGHDLVNLRVSTSLTPSITAFMRVTNLTDTRYAERADFAFGQDRYFVGEPRGFYFGLTADL